MYFMSITTFLKCILSYVMGVNILFVFPFQDHVKEKLKLVQKFLHIDTQDQLTSLEESMKNSEITMVRYSLLEHENNYWF